MMPQLRSRRTRREKERRGRTKAEAGEELVATMLVPPDLVFRSSHFLQFTPHGLSLSHMALPGCFHGPNLEYFQASSVSHLQCRLSTRASTTCSRLRRSQGIRLHGPSSLHAQKATCNRPGLIRHLIQRSPNFADRNGLKFISSR